MTPAAWRPVRHCLEIGTCLETADDEIEWGLFDDPARDGLHTFPLWGAPHGIESALGIRRRQR